MTLCSYCGTQLPDKASFCAHCGHNLVKTGTSAPQKQGKQQAKAGEKEQDKKVRQTPSSSRSGAPQNRETLAPSMPAKTPSPARPQVPQAKGTPIPQTPPLADVAALETRAMPVKTPLPVESEAIEARETLALQTPPPVDAAALETRTMPAPPAPANPPAPTRVQSIEEQKTLVVSPTPQKPPARNKIEEQKTLVVSPTPQKPPARNKAEIADQKTRVVPTVGKVSRPGPTTGNAGQRRVPPIEALNTLQMPAANQATRSGPPRTEVYTDGTFIIYKGNQPGSNTAIRTRVMPVTPPPKAPPTFIGRVRELIWRVISPIFIRARDTEPERPARPLPSPTLLGWLPIIALTNALGLFTVVTAYNAARDNTPGSELYFWLGTGLIFVPALVRLILPQASRVERVGLLITVALCLYLVRVTLSPLYFSGYDEFLHWRTVNDIMSTGHLFTKNPLLPVSPYYPGLEIVTSALSNLSGLTTFQSGLIVVCAACMVMVLSLYLLCEQLSGSARLASIATIIYMTNPHFIFFDNQFAYESLALPLATFVMYAMARYEALEKGRRWVMLSAWIVLTAMILTHHLTNFIFEGLFLLWATIYLFLRPLPLRKSIVILTVIFGLILTAITLIVIGNTVIGYFTSFFSDVGAEIAQALNSSGGGSRQLFANTGAQPTPFWERIVSLGSVGLITLSIPFFLLCFWRRYRQNTLVWVFAIIVIFYPVLQVLRLTSSGAEASDRASAFIFIAICFLGAIAIVQFWPVRLLNWKQPALISAAILVLFMGGIILGDGTPPSFMPGPYEVSADSRSIDPEGIQAAVWTHVYLGPNNRMYTDRINQLLMSVYGDQYLVTKIGDNIDATDVFFDPTFSAYDTSLLQEGQIHYLVVDMRLSKGLPQDGFYFEQGEPDTNGYATPMNPQLLTKFDSVPQMNRLFDSGDIVIYDTGELINAPQKP